MAGRIRSIKPEILEDEKTAALSHLAWRLFVSLWLIADDYGNLRGEPVYVLGQTLWATNETRETIAGALEEISGVGLIVRYAVRGQSYCHIAGWAKHQKVTHIGKPRMPGPDEADTASDQHVETLVSVSGNPPETLSPDLRSPTSDLRSPTEGSPPAIPQPVPLPAQQPVPTARPGSSDLAARTALRESLRSELEAARARAGAARRLAVKPLLAFDRGIDTDLTDHLARATTPAALAKIGDQARHAIAMAELEVTHGGKSFEWFTGAIFAGGNFSRLAGMTAADAKRPARAAKGDPLPPAPAPPRPERPPPDPVLSPEDRAAISALAARVGANPEAAAASLKPADRSTPEVHKLYGQRAPPSSAEPIADDRKPKSRKAAT